MTVSQKTKSVRDRLTNLEELPKIVKNIETELRKGYSLFFQDNLLSGEEVRALQESPSRLQIFVNKFHSWTANGSLNKEVVRVSLESLEEECPKNSGLIYGRRACIDVSLERLLAGRLAFIANNLEAECAKAAPTQLKLSVVYVHNLDILAVDVQKLGASVDLIRDLYGPETPALIFPANSSPQEDEANSKYLYLRWFQELGCTTSLITVDDFLQRLSRLVVDRVAISTPLLTSRSDRLFAQTQEHPADRTRICT